MAVAAGRRGKEKATALTLVASLWTLYLAHLALCGCPCPAGASGLLASRAATRGRHEHVEHIVHTDCRGDVRIEHYGMEAQEHTWPGQVDGTDTYRLMWEFLSDFTN